MENSAIYPEVAAELIEIFKFVEEPVLEKIPEKLKEELSRIADKNSKFKIDKTKKLSEQKILPETKQLLSGIFIKYCCRQQDGEEILVACKENDMKIEQEKREKYNPDKIFEKKEETKPCFKLVIVKKEPWYKKIIKSIGRIFRIWK